MTTFVFLHMHQPVTCATYSICEEKKVGTTCIYSNEASLFLGREREREKRREETMREHEEGTNRRTFILRVEPTHQSIYIHTQRERETSWCIHCRRSDYGNHRSSSSCGCCPMQGSKQRQAITVPAVSARHRPKGSHLGDCTNDAVLTRNREPRQVSCPTVTIDNVPKMRHKQRGNTVRKERGCLAQSETKRIASHHSVRRGATTRRESQENTMDPAVNMKRGNRRKQGVGKRL